MSAGADAQAFFDRTLAEWRCDRCATEFAVRSTFGSMSHKSLTCPVCDADEEDLTGLSDVDERGVKA
jgi:Zn finger protein HypA/HybF involved in hydrogenase expression